MLRDLLAAQPLVAVGLNAQQLLLVVPLVQRLGLVEALVALQPDEVGAQRLRQHLADLGLAGAGRAFDQQRPLERKGEVENGLDCLAGDVARARQAVANDLASDLHRARSSAGHDRGSTGAAYARVVAATFRSPWR